MDRPLVLQEFEAPRISRQLAHEGGKVISLTHRPSLSPRRYPWYSFLLGRSKKYVQQGSTFLEGDMILLEHKAYILAHK
jgi:hypothetical protein